MTAWLSNDAAWSKARRAQWSAIKEDLALGRTLTARDLKDLKEYFLNGVVKDAYGFKEPAICSSLPLIFAFWLHPSRTQLVFDALVKQADLSSIRYSEKYVGRLALAPLPTVDDAMPMFYELFYATEGKRILAMDSRTKTPQALTPRTFSALDVWISFLGWTIQDQPYRNPISSVLILRLEQLPDDDCMSLLSQYEQTGEAALFVSRLRHIIADPAERRHSTVSSFLAMLKAGKLPRPLIDWLGRKGFG